MRITSISTSGRAPVAMATRQAMSGVKLERHCAETMAANAVPAAAMACTMALPTPRRAGFHTSLNSTMPAPHSPPTPMPAMKRKASRDWKLHATAESSAPAASSSSVNISAFLRPIRSPSQPIRMPPNTEPISVADTIRPNCGRLRCSDDCSAPVRNAMMIRL